MIPDVNSVFSLQISERPTASYTVAAPCTASPAYTAPPCLVPLTNRPTAHQRRSTKRLRMLCSPVTDILVSSRTASLLHAGGEAEGGARFIVMTGRRWVTCRPAPRIISRRVSIRLFRAVAVWFFLPRVRVYVHATSFVIHRLFCPPEPAIYFAAVSSFHPQGQG